MTILLFLAIQAAFVGGCKALVAKYPADPELAKVAAHERRIDNKRESLQTPSTPEININH